MSTWGVCSDVRHYSEEENMVIACGTSRLQWLMMMRSNTWGVLREHE